jgi:hypothetical protein
MLKIKISDPAIKEINVTLSITPMWWEVAKLIPKNSSEEIILNDDNQFDFVEKATIDDIFEGTTKEGFTICGIITSKDASSVTVGGTVTAR